MSQRHRSSATLRPLIETKFAAYAQEEGITARDCSSAE